MKKIFFIELGTEELPAKLLKNIAKNLLKKFILEFQKNYIKYEKIEWFASSRRLAIKVKNINFKKTFKKKIQKGPSIKQSFNNDGSVKKSALFWMKKLKICLKDTKILKKKNKKWLIYPTKKNFKNIKKILCNIIFSIILKIKSFYFMRWNEKKYKFYRPLRNLVVLLNEKIINIKIFDVISTRFTKGNFFIKNKKIKIIHAKKYPKILIKKGYVYSNYYIRRKKIIKKIKNILKKIKKTIRYKKSLLNEITSIVEWPQAIIGKFKKKFLKIPENFIIHILENIQKIFPLFNKNKKLSNYFIFIINSKNKKNNHIIKGINSIIESRLQDANFFFKKDKKKKILNNLSLLKKKIFYNKLGNIYDKVQRIKKIIKIFYLYVKFNKKKAIISANLSKCDLLNNIVIEYPELQGVAGSYYAEQEGFDKKISKAIKEQYKPINSYDDTPKTTIGAILSLSDKLDSLVGVFIIQKKISENYDPFALRRLSIGILKIIINNNIFINIKYLLKKIFYIYKIKNFKKKNILKIKNFIIKRFYKIYKKKKNYKNVIKSVLKINNEDINVINKKIQTIFYFLDLPKSKKIILLYKRIINILNKNKNIKIEKKNIKNFENQSEKIFFKKIKKINFFINILNKSKKFKKIINQLLKIEKLINYFFTNFMINHHNIEIKKNRLYILKKIKKIFYLIANFSYLI